MESCCCGKPRHVLFISGFSRIAGGGQRSLLLLLKHLDRAAFAPSVLVAEDCEVAVLARSLGVPVIVREYPMLRPWQLGGLAAFCAFLRKTARERGFEIIHTDTPDIALMSALAFADGLAETVFHARVSERSRHDLLIELFSSAVIAVSRAVSRRFFLADNLFVIYNGADCAQYQPRGGASAKAALGIAPDALTIGYAGQLEQSKGLDCLLEAFAALKPRLGNAKLVLAGRGAMQAELPCRISRLGIAGDVVMTGFAADTAALYPAFDIAALPSRAPEGFSRMIIEAMACGVPVIASDSGGNPEAVRGGETGFLFPAGDASALAEKIMLLAENPSLRAKMAAAALAAARGGFTAEKTARAVENAYRMLPRRRRFIRFALLTLRRLLLAPFHGLRDQLPEEQSASGPKSRRPDAAPDGGRATPEKILLIRTDRIGDMVLSTPFFSAMRKKYPAAEITLLARPFAKELLRASPEIDRFIEWRGWRAGDIFRLRACGFDMAIDMLADRDCGTAALAALSGSRVAAGFDMEGRGLFLNLRAPRPLGLHFTGELQILAETAGADAPHGLPFLIPQAHALDKMRGRLAQSGISGGDKILLVHPGAHSPLQRWPARRFAEAAALCADATGCKIAVAAQLPHELDEIRAVLGDGAVCFHSLGLDDFTALAFLSGAFFGNSSGPFHIACAAGAKSLCIMPPQDGIRWKPLPPDCAMLESPDGLIASITAEQAVPVLSGLVRRASAVDARRGS
ncbi:MAG: glycosyltransferase [Elusimicrobiales bacterium]